MALALGTAGLVLIVLTLQLAWPSLKRALARLREQRAARRAAAAREGGGYDPGRELRAEQRARELLRSCIEDHDWAMYRDLGFLRVWGGLGARPASAEAAPQEPRTPYAYLIYPHRPIVAYMPQGEVLLSEYCVEFPDQARPYGGARLPDSDDVLAKWMALKADERGLISEANMHLPGRQIDPEMVRRDLLRLARWEREHEARRRADIVRAA
jgi:hypothetical protein